MSRATPDDQLRFLLSCVKHATNGRVDFVEVAKECGVVSKGAAAKRYERLMKANGISPTTSSVTSSNPKPTQSKQKAKYSDEKPSAGKKPKLDRRSPAYTLKRVEDSPRSTTVITANPRCDGFESTPAKSEAVNHSARHTLSGPAGMPQPTMGATMFAPGFPVIQGISMSARQRAALTGLPPIACSAGHQLVPDVPIYPHFPPAFRDPWSFTGQGNGSPATGFEVYSNRDSASHHSQGIQPPLSGEGMLMKLPPQPQEIVPIQTPKEHQKEGDGASKSKDHVVIVE
ncbi:hypothetical protein AYL99_08524 [Fonsecaea erecta]|uniref:Myb-like DNA-binding domain-containing protein n=1 Tax=Fonsecaea erecta TaxID=1367422 RepID=A0A178ZE86_9EURO|nr:hypothetical protein AYL99_08524 [Fonsecaea erecta]OAP57786.1 hypothetical protein AYL99_08524 [Fonsecaea erecta]